MLQETVCVRETASQGQQFDHLLQLLIKKKKKKLLICLLGHKKKNREPARMSSNLLDHSRMSSNLRECQRTFSNRRDEILLMRAVPTRRAATCSYTYTRLAPAVSRSRLLKRCSRSLSHKETAAPAAGNADSSISKAYAKS